MLYVVYWDGHYVGTVVAKNDEEAKLRAQEKFQFHGDGVLEVRPRLTRAVEV